MANSEHQHEMALSIVVPCYNEEEVLPETSRRLAALLDRLVEDDLVTSDSRVYFVDDGSADRTWELIESQSQADPRFQGIKLTRNHGHQNALLAGLFTVPGDLIVSIDADLQDDIEVIINMVKRAHAGDDIVFGVRQAREKDTMSKRVTAQMFYKLMRRMGVDLIYNHADYRLMSRQAIEILKDFPEINLFLRGLIPLIGLKTSVVEYDREERFAGESKYPLRRQISLALNGITSFSVTPLRMITTLGLVMFLISTALGLWAIWLRLATDAVVPGWASITVPIFLLGGVQLLALGTIGEYLAKTYMETKRRPRFLIETTTQKSPDGQAST